MGSAGPFRARKFTYYEGRIRVPAIVRWPGRVPSGRVDGESVWAAVDWLPTVCALAEAPLGDYRPDGKNVIDMLKGAAVRNHRELVWALQPDRMAIRDDDWKLDEFRGAVSLFSLAQDPFEQNNLATRETERVQQLQTRLEGYRQHGSE